MNGGSMSKIADTPQGWAIHAMVLDIDVGPLLQTHKLLTSVIFARAKGYTRPLTAAELEMMNLTGDGTGLDMVTMPQAMREQVPTSNFFQRSAMNATRWRSATTRWRNCCVTDSRMDATVICRARKISPRRFNSSPSSRNQFSRHAPRRRGIQ